MGTNPRRPGRPVGERLAVGRAGERVAAGFLEKRGYRVVGSGFLARRGELDLVCRHGDRLVIVEVKARSSDRYGSPAEAVGERKRRALAAAAAEYRALAGWSGPIDFEVVSVRFGPDGRPAVELLDDVF